MVWRVNDGTTCCILKPDWFDMFSHLKWKEMGNVFGKLRRMSMQEVVLIILMVTNFIALIADRCPRGDQLPFPVIPKKYRQYSRCIIEKTQYVTPVLETAQLLRTSNHSLIRFGDADVELILGWDRYFQKADTVLSDRLTRIFQSTTPNLVIGLYDAFSGFQTIQKSGVDWWMDSQYHYRSWVRSHCNYSRQYVSAVISSPYMHSIGTNCYLLKDTYETLRWIWADKDILLLRGDNKQTYTFDVYDTARNQKIYFAPRYQAWSRYEQLREELLKEDPQLLYIMACGPLGKVLAYDLTMAGRRALDLGHLAKDYNIYKSRIAAPNQTDFYYND